jgi:hypothetical protein
MSLMRGYCDWQLAITVQGFEFKRLIVSAILPAIAGRSRQRCINHPVARDLSDSATPIPKTCLLLFVARNCA